VRVDAEPFNGPNNKHSTVLRVDGVLGRLGGQLSLESRFEMLFIRTIERFSVRCQREHLGVSLNCG